MDADLRRRDTRARSLGYHPAWVDGGSPPSDALAIVLDTSGLTHRIKDGELKVIRIAPP